MSAAAEDPWLAEHPPKIQWLPFFAEAHYQNPEDPFVKLVMEAAREVAGNGG